jgi:AcrR family transcriptional regulator
VVTTTSSRPGPRERLLGAARDLTYQHGVGVGVDAILTEADVARRSLYQHFGGKDQLITEMLRQTAERDVERYRQALEAGGARPRERLLSLFEAVYTVVGRPTFHGCRYAAAELGLADPEHPGHAVVREYKQRLHDLLDPEARALGHPDPSAAADQLLLLIDGILVSAASGPAARSVAATRGLVDAVLGAAG